MLARASVINIHASLPKYDTYAFHCSWLGTTSAARRLCVPVELRAMRLRLDDHDPAPAAWEFDQTTSIPVRRRGDSALQAEHAGGDSRRLQPDHEQAHGSQVNGSFVRDRGRVST